MNNFNLFGIIIFSLCVISNIVGAVLYKKQRLAYIGAAIGWFSALLCHLRCSI